MTSSQDPALDPLEAGRAALARAAWPEARAQLKAALEQRGEDPEVLESLGLAGWWLDDAALTFDARERAYRLYRERGDARGAARVAIWLVWDYLSFRGEFAVASGWLERARRLLQGLERTPEYGWLLVCARRRLPCSASTTRTWHRRGPPSNAEIAGRLRVSEHTVKRHVANLLTRLGLPSRAAAAAHATKLGLI